MATGASNADLAVLLVDARKGLLEPDPAPRHHRRPARHPPRRAGGQQDGSGRLRPRGVRAHRRRLQQLRRRRSASRTSPASRFRRATATMFRRASGRTPWYAGPPLLEHLETRRRRGRPRRQAVPHAGAMGQPAAIPISAALPAPSPAAASKPATRSWCCRRAKPRSVKRIVGRAAASSTAAQAGDAVTVTLADEIDIARGDMLARAARPPAGRRPVRRAPGLDGERASCCPAAPI